MPDLAEAASAAEADSRIFSEIFSGVCSAEASEGDSAEATREEAICREKVRIFRSD